MTTAPRRPNVISRSKIAEKAGAFSSRNRASSLSTCAGATWSNFPKPTIEMCLHSPGTMPILLAIAPLIAGTILWSISADAHASGQIARNSDAIGACGRPGRPSCSARRRPTMGFGARARFTVGAASAGKSRSNASCIRQIRTKHELSARGDLVATPGPDDCLVFSP